MEGGRKRKALSDCTNTVHQTTTAKRPSLASAFKKVPANDTGKAVINSNSKPGLVSSSENVVESATVSPSSSVAVASMPTKSSMVSGSVECDVVEPCSVYSRRRTTDRRESKGKEVVGSSPISVRAIGDGNKEDEVIGAEHCASVRHKKIHQNLIHLHLSGPIRVTTAGLTI